MKIWRLGPGHNYDVRDSDYTVASISSKIMRAYNAKASTATGYTDNAPDRDNKRERSKSDTAARSVNPGTHACVTRHIKDIIHCLGGIQVLFPISEQLDQPVRELRRQVLLKYYVDEMTLRNRR